MYRIRVNRLWSAACIQHLCVGWGLCVCKVLRRVYECVYMCVEDARVCVWHEDCVCVVCECVCVCVAEF